METETRVDEGTYEVLRVRLAAQATELARRAEALNTARIAEFGSTELALTGTGQLRSEQGLVVSDAVAVGDCLLLGHHTPAGSGEETAVGDVFTLYDRDLKRLAGEGVPGLLDDPDFRREFEALHRYYRGARLRRLRIVDGRLLAVFCTGEHADDIRVLRWSLSPAGAPRFLDAQGERDHLLAPADDITWVQTTRDDHIAGRHPRIRLAGAVSVSTLGGTLTVLAGEEALFSEPVDEPLQSLADAEVAYAVVGALLLLRIRPYQEESRRHLVVNALTRSVVRLDGIGQSCRRLPDNQGIVFPGGYCLATGTVRTFDIDTAGLAFEHTVRSPNGEDVLYAFHSPASGRTVLLPYNLIRKEVATPLVCGGYALFDDGALATLYETSDEPARVHPVRLWQTPYISDVYAATVPAGHGHLARIGNADLVRGISDCLAVARQVSDARATEELYEALVESCTRTVDRHPWLGEPETGDPRSLLEEVRATAGQVLAEFRTVQALTHQAAEAFTEAAESIQRLDRRLRAETAGTAEEWTDRITELRRAQGRLVSLAEMRYADTGAIAALAEDVEDRVASTAHRAIGFLQREDAFADHHARVRSLTAAAEAITTVAEAAPVTERLDQQTSALRTLTEVVAGLDGGDATARTAILENITDVVGGLNRARATVDARRRELLEGEKRASFTAEFALLGQSVTGALAAADTPESCDEQLSRLLHQVDSLESRFADHDRFLAEIADKRTEIHDAFSARKQALTDARARRAERLATSAGRVLETITRQVTLLESIEAVHTYFTSDPMVEKVRRTVGELRDLGDVVRAEELEGRIKAAREEARRAVRDRTELFADGGSTIRLGAHVFAVNTQPCELTLVPQNGGAMAFALTGTDYRAPVADPEFAATRAHWDQTLPSENDDVYRAEYLAARLIAEHGAEYLAAADLPSLVRRAAEAAYDEGYERGVHDHDATGILAAFLQLHERAGLLRYPAADRAAAQLFWAHRATPDTRRAWAREAASLVRARETFGAAPTLDALRADMTDAGLTAHAAEYLVEELATGESFTTSTTAHTLLDKFRRTVGSTPYADDISALLATGDHTGAQRLAEGWLTSYATTCGEDVDPGDLAEAVAIEICPGLGRHDVDAPLTTTVDGLLGTHPRIDRRTLRLRLDEFLARTGHFAQDVAPGFRAYQRRRHSLLAAERRRLRLAEYHPRVMSSFVRNRLVDEVYLPLVGDSLARQLGAAGDSKRTDNSGLLLLLSPPGYGKTTLMEYVADRLGLLLVKVDGPALGHGVTSLDPAAAPNTAARQELEKIDFALAAGNNVMLYVDDIQHTSSELLQKFIPLCDTTRTLNGHDLRGKRFAVCMAGNPYTESGQLFRIPDMLANRADVWNLGDVLTGREAAFAMSFVENALASHPVLAPLAGRDRADLELLVRLAAGDPAANPDRLTGPYAPAELDRVLAVLRHLLTARETVLAVNAAYMASAARTDTTRTEPAFLLQGSYRNMNKIAARISPVMNDTELAAVIDDHYAAEAHTLTTGAEANLLKLAALRGTLTEEQAARWAAITAAHVRTQALGDRGDDPLARAVNALGLLADRVAAVETAIIRATGPRPAPGHPSGRHAAPPNDVRHP
ncbi:DNA repair ATPase [Streptomyces sannanensis]|uniref:DNA repair ATPase n=1 Tax=Streptomyces sannanensis TaxID=285536 RepID=A0ABP6S3R4_9ACTN